MSQEQVNQEVSQLFLEESCDDSNGSNLSSTTNINQRNQIDNTLNAAEEIETDGDSSDEVEKTKKGRGPNRQYNQLEKFDQLEAVLDHIKNNFKNYHYRYTRDSYDGDKRYFTCNGFDKCPKAIYLLIVSKN